VKSQNVTAEIYRRNWDRDRMTLLQDSATGKYIFRIEGFCPICATPAKFTAVREDPLSEEWWPSWFRDFLICDGCGSVPRHRALFATVERYYPNWRQLDIHESSGGAYAASLKLRNEAASYLDTQYDPSIGFGNMHERGYRSEDLEAQTFADEQFDLVITQDVFEHLFDPAAAIREIARTLRPGGAYICTVPIVMGSAPSRRRARLVNGRIENLLEPQYHINPMSEQGSLVCVDWGYDIAAFLTQESGLVVTIVNIDDPSRGIRAAYNEVIVAQKLKAPSIL
jgi:SAM-dependent methyltransferase